MENYEYVEYTMIAFALFFVVLEIILNLNDLDNDSTNLMLLEWSQGRAFFIPFAFGAIGGHLFLGTKNPFFDINFAIPVIGLFVLALIMLLIGIFVPFKKGKIFLSSLFVLGLLYGHFLWSMNV